MYCARSMITNVRRCFLLGCALCYIYRAGMSALGESRWAYSNYTEGSSCTEAALFWGFHESSMRNLTPGHFALGDHGRIPNSPTENGRWTLKFLPIIMYDYMNSHLNLACHDFPWRKRKQPLSSVVNDSCQLRLDPDSLILTAPMSMSHLESIAWRNA